MFEEVAASVILPGVSASPTVKGIASVGVPRGVTCAGIGDIVGLSLMIIVLVTVVPSTPADAVSVSWNVSLAASIPAFAIWTVMAFARFPVCENKSAAGSHIVTVDYSGSAVAGCKFTLNEPSEPPVRTTSIVR